MDNATNALIMAAEILIAILVLSLIVTVNVLFGSFSRNVNDQIARNRDTAFNAHFYNYLNRANISASEVASIINFAKTTNDENGYKRISPADTTGNKSAPYYINVYINGTSFFYGFKDPAGNEYMTNTKYEKSADFKDTVNQFISDYKQQAFCCNVEKIKFTSETDASGKTIVNLQCKNDANCDVSIIDNLHPNVKQDGNIRVVRISFHTVDKISITGGNAYDITTSNEYVYRIQ